jgi:hypothetical protein
VICSTMHLCLTMISCLFFVMLDNNNVRKHKCVPNDFVLIKRAALCSVQSYGVECLDITAQCLP